MSRNRRQQPLYEVLSGPYRRAPGTTHGAFGHRTPEEADGAGASTEQPSPAPTSPGANTGEASGGTPVVLRREPMLPVPEFKPTPPGQHESGSPVARPATFDELRSHTMHGQADTHAHPHAHAAPSGRQVGGAQGGVGGSGHAPQAAATKPLPISAISLTCALIIVLGVVLWTVAYRMGKAHEAQALSPYTQDPALAANDQAAGGGSIKPPAPRIDPSKGTPPQGVPKPGPDKGAGKPNPAPVAPAPPGFGTDPRKIGNNYLMLAVLSARDAQEAVAYLGKNGVTAAAVPNTKVDPQTARAKNLLFQVFVADGVASERFRESQAACEALETKVQEIGKRWRREERGASDFTKPYWALCKE